MTSGIDLVAYGKMSKRIIINNVKIYIRDISRSTGCVQASFQSDHKYRCDYIYIA